MEATILRSEVLRQLDGGEPFHSLEFVKCDRKRGTGGELVKLTGWAKMTTDPLPEVRKTDGSLAISKRKTKKVVNLFNPQNRMHHPIGVHLLLMLTFNGKRILNG